MTAGPSPNGQNGGARDAQGRFVAGNRGGPGNPHARRVGLLRAALLRAVKPADVAEIVAALITSAKGGDVGAAREILNRTLGAPVPADILERIDALERMVEARQDEFLR